MKAHVDALADDIWLIRFGASFEKYGDPYDGVCTFVKTGPDFGMVVGLAGKFNRESFGAIKEALNRCGINTAEWERIKGNRTKVHRASDEKES